MEQRERQTSVNIWPILTPIDTGKFAQAKRDYEDGDGGWVPSFQLMMFISAMIIVLILRFYSYPHDNRINNYDGQQQQHRQQHRQQNYYQKYD